MNEEIKLFLQEYNKIQLDCDARVQNGTASVTDNLIWLQTISEFWVDDTMTRKDAQ
jgi:hypothetical protein